MIVENPPWIHCGRKENTIDKKTKGKWVVFGKGNELKSYFKKLVLLVENGEIYGVKYNPKKHLELDPLPYDPLVMCVYADDFTKKRTLEIVNSIGIEESFWKYDWQTKLDWKEGGELYQKAMEQKRRYLHERMILEGKWSF